MGSTCGWCLVMGPLSVAVNNGEVGWQVVLGHRALSGCGSGRPRALLGSQRQWAELGHWALCCVIDLGVGGRDRQCPIRRPFLVVGYAHLWRLR